VGGAHRDARLASANLKKAIVENLDLLAKTPVPSLLERRLEKYSRMGAYLE
jgi:acetyl-CoA carboxylase alpha subunit